LKQLKALGLDGTRATNVGVKELQQALPNCTIIHGSPSTKP
jgi:hypothetical protein